MHQLPILTCISALVATQGQMNGFFSQLPFKSYLQEVASVGDQMKICPQLDSRVDMHEFDEALEALVGDEFPRIRPPLNHPFFCIDMHQFYCKETIRFSGSRVLRSEVSG